MAPKLAITTDFLASSRSLEPRGARTGFDAAPSLEELRALRLDTDIVAPADAELLREEIGSCFQEQPSSGDNLRLPQRTQFTGAQIRAALARVIDATPSAGAGEVAQQKEDAMQRVLRAVESTVAQIMSASKVSI
jgi:hypothetical protein